MSVNEAVRTGTVGPDGRRRWCEVDMVAMGWCCSAPKENEVSSCAGQGRGFVGLERTPLLLIHSTYWLFVSPSVV
jgi:hypothetical protein